jgi:hypothetical protein
LTWEVNDASRVYLNGKNIPATVRNTVLQLSKEQYDQYFGTRETIMSWDGYTDAAWFK